MVGSWIRALSIRSQTAQPWAMWAFELNAIPSGGTRPLAIPQGARSAQMHLPCVAVPCPTWSRLATIGRAMEASTQRLRPHVRRPNLP